MTGRPIRDEESLLKMGYSHPHFICRRAALRGTLAALTSADPPDYFRTLASKNLKGWYRERSKETLREQARVIFGVWGDVTLALSRKYGVCFAVFNMANSFVPGGA